MSRLRSNLFLVFSAVFFAAAVGWRITRPDPAAAAGAQLRGTVLAAGETVPGFWRDLGMAQAPRGPVLVTFLTTECPWCRITVPRWNRIHAAVAQVPGGAAVAVSLSPADSTAGYPAQTGLRIPIHVVGDRAVERRWKVVAVPYTLVMEPSGRVAGSWRGALTDEAVDEVVARLRRSAAGR